MAGSVEAEREREEGGRETITDVVNVPDKVGERRVSPEGFEDLSLVEEGVNQVRVVLQLVSQTRVHDLQQHQQNLFNDGLIRRLAMGERKEWFCVKETNLWEYDKKRACELESI